MAVTAAPHGRVPVAWMSSREKSTGRFRQAWNLISFVFHNPGLWHSLTRLNQLEQRIHCCGPCSAAPARPIRSSVDRYEAARRRLSRID